MSVPIVSTELIDNICNFASEIFDSHFIQDMDTRRAVAKMLLQDPSFMTLVADRFTFETELLGTDAIANAHEHAESSKLTVTLYVLMTPTQRAILIANNSDVHLVFKEGGGQPHALAYAQRIIDRQRCQRNVSYRTGVILDIGGNYATHAMTGETRIHSCTLKSDVEEFHRQTQRDVNLAMGEYMEASRCVHGVENCDVMAREAFSIHTLPRIDPQTIPYIFYKHGLEFVTGVHHYDPALDTEKKGYMPGVEMHWKRNDNDVEFFFDGDSSYGYTHRYDWLRRYSCNTYFSHPDYSFIVYYSVDKLSNGILYWSMMKQQKETLANQVMPLQYRYTGEPEKIVLQVPQFDSTLGFPITDPRAYPMSSIVVPDGLFEYTYKIAFANSTNRPDNPLSLTDVRDHVHTYNFMRKANGSNLTITQRLNALDADKISVGLYLIVVLKRAQLSVTAAAYTNVFKRLQKRWGDESLSMLLAKSFSSAAMFPFAMLASNASEVVDLMSVHMRAYIKSTKTVSSVQDTLPYYIISPAMLIKSTGEREFTSGARHVDQPNIEDSPENLQRFYNLFKDDFPPEMEEQIRKKLDVEKQQISEVQQQQQDAIETAEEYAKLYPEFADTREEWDVAHTHIMENTKQQPYDPVEVDFDVIAKEIPAQIYESAVYNLDVALNTIAMGVKNCKDTWGSGAPMAFAVASRNNTTDNEIKYFLFNDGLCEDAQSLKRYNILLDPTTLKILYLDDGALPEHYVHYNGYLFAYKSFETFVGLRLKEQFLKFLHNLKVVRKYDFCLVDGVPGCGKTYDIVNQAVEGDLIVCAVKVTADHTRDVVLKRNPNFGASRVRTIDSCILNGVPKAKTVFVDEGLAAKPGSVHYVAQMAKCSSVRIFGDSEQIGSLDFGSKLGALRYMNNVFFTKITYENVTVRCPADVTFAMRTLYAEHRRPHIKTYSNVRRSITLVHESDLENPVYKVPEPNTTVMTFSRADRAKILASGGYLDAKSEADTTNRAVVMSVHEAQGSSVPHATVVRTNPHSAAIFDSTPHRLVALTRHTSTFRWISVLAADADSFSKLLLIAVNATEQELDEVMLPTPDWLEEKIKNTPPRGTIR